MNIRHLEKSDSAALVDIYKFTSVTENTSQLPYLSSETVEGIFYNESNYTLVAELEGRVVGHLTFFLSTKPRERHSASIAIAVHPDTQGSGVGKLLMAKAIEQADNWLNLVRIELTVHADNHGAIALYEKSGFQLEGEKRFATFKAGKYLSLFVMSRISPHFAG
jgi:putative acetyltransferase